VFSGTTVTVSTRADFVVEGTVDFVLFGTEDGGEIGRYSQSDELASVILKTLAEYVTMGRMKGIVMNVGGKLEVGRTHYVTLMSLFLSLFLPSYFGLRV
jgi:hypothetical protein